MNYFVFVFYFRERECKWGERGRGGERERGGEGGRESQADSMLSTEPDVGLGPMTLGS